VLIEQLEHRGVADIHLVLPRSGGASLAHAAAAQLQAHVMTKQTVHFCTF